MNIKKEMDIEELLCSFPELSDRIIKALEDAEMHAPGEPLPTGTFEEQMALLGWTEEKRTEFLAHLSSLLREEGQIVLTPDAAAQLREIAEEEGHAQCALRLGHQGKGCRGLKYTLALAEESQESDVVFESQGVLLYVDSEQLPELVGCTIDYVDDCSGAGFRVSSSQSYSSCGCQGSCGCGGSCSCR